MADIFLSSKFLIIVIQIGLDRLYIKQMLTQIMTGNINLNANNFNLKM